MDAGDIEDHKGGWGGWNGTKTAVGMAEAEHRSKVLW